MECVGLLLQCEGIEVNAEDMKGEATPLQYAALAGHEAAVDLLLSYGASCGPEIQTVLREKLPHLDPVWFSTARTARPLKNILFNLIELGDGVAGLETYVAGRTSVDWDADNGQHTLLQYACEMGRAGVVRVLLERGAACERTAANTKPGPVIAASHGHHRVLRVFTERLSEAQLKAVMLRTDEHHGRRTLLHEVLRRSSAKLDTGNTDDVDYEECLKILLDENKTIGRKQKTSMAKLTERIINFRDSNGETALHYATQQPNQEIIKLLLRHGANMGVKNREGKAPVSRILPSTLEEFFTSCVEPQGIITDDKFKLTFNYNFLAPPLLDSEILQEFETKKKDAENPEVTHPRPETEALWYMSESAQHRTLLKHPVISSFLWMKWQRIRKFFYVGLVFYFLFVASLTLLIMLDYGGCSIRPGGDYQSCPQSLDTTVLRILVGVFVALLFGLEVVQVAVSFKRYVASLENIVQNTILLLTAILILDTNMTFQTGRHIAAVLIVGSWLMFLIYFGLHPSLNTKVFMFYSVATSFCKFLLWYVFVIIAFALSFYIMFHTDYEGAESNEDYPFFDDIGSCMTKSLAMFVGELEFSDIPFTNNPISTIMFIAFIFFIVVVLMNLLNGLAVSDITIIRDEAEVLSLKSQVDLISYWESILLNDPYNFLTSWPRLLASLPSLSCCYWVKRMPGCESVLSRLTGGTKILLFYQCLPLKTATFYPNKRVPSCNPYKKRVRVEPESQADFGPELEVRKDILETAKMLILDQQRDEKEDTSSEIIEKIRELEVKLDLILKSVKT